MKDDAPGTGSMTIEIDRIMELLPHRYPFLMVDRMIDVVLSESAVGIKNVTANDNFFQGHFPSKPVMPGVMIVEAMAQTAGALVMESLELANTGKLVFFMSVENARFRRPVGPGDQLFLHVKKIHTRKNVWKFKGVAEVGGKAVAEATYSAMIMDD
jgi:3-hydroxyacyl-[acyl-carrier-protein] dehydratase